MENKKKRKFGMENIELTLLSIPTITWFILFCYLPIMGIIMAFKRYRIFPRKGFFYSLLNSEWVGLNNFKFILKTNDIYILLRNTIVYNIIFIIMGIVIPVTLAILIKELYSTFRSKLYQTLMFFPYFMSWVIVSYFIYAFLSTDKGVINNILVYFGKERVSWYTQSDYWPYLLVFIRNWKATGYGMIVYLATIAGIDPTLYEAAVVDGASKWQQVKYITLPGLKRVIIIMFILSVGGIFYSDFGLFYQSTRGVPGSLFNVAATLDTYVFNALKGGSPIGTITAVALLQSIACCITILTANYIVKKVDKESAII
ncbi:ABC transporter permease [Oceanivirga salmonicida]|uniref:ABC transporter permease n=1 Tax=Oceanivirga salmonicida TaxID=1769291 RepID=UPI0018D2399B|nr:ABC transporter permease subunit [Oceanivirga salmonicida]